MRQLSLPVYRDECNGGYTIGTTLLNTSDNKVLHYALFQEEEDGRWVLVEFFNQNPTGKKPQILASSPRWTLDQLEDINYTDPSIGSRNNPANESKVPLDSEATEKPEYNPKRIITLEEVHKLCVQYDNINGAWPESTWEGKSIWDFILDNIDDESIES